MITFTVFGIPKPQPRVRAFACKMGGGKFAARVYDPGTAEGWKSCIAECARAVLPTAPLSGPLHLTLHFRMPRPKSHYRTGKNAGMMRPDAPNYHSSKPDADNLTKAVKDAMTLLGFWRDDGQVAITIVEKTYALHPGCEVKVRQLEAAA